jgi:hypothetical protein
MIRQDNSKFLLYIEPPASEKSAEPVNDELTTVMELALSKAKAGIANYDSLNAPAAFHEGPGYRGFHLTACKQCSGNHDYLLENGMITNDLCVFYLQYYRRSIPERDMNMVKQLAEFYKVAV